MTELVVAESGDLKTRYLGTMDFKVGLDVIRQGLEKSSFDLLVQNRGIACDECKHVGFVERKCAACQGEGEIPQKQIEADTVGLALQKCQSCEGSGNVKGHCSNCVKRHEFIVSFVPGVPFGTILPIEVPSLNAKIDLRLVQLPHPDIKRMAAPHQEHLFVFVPISLKQALGLETFHVALKNLDAEVLHYESVPGKIYASGDMHRFEGKGLPIYKANESKDGKESKASKYGDLILQFDVKFPEAAWFDAPGRREKIAAMFHEVMKEQVIKEQDEKEEKKEKKL